ncbi:MAG TPA: SCO family protein [Rhodocyclaceae bacterium]|nr:SCO family protein [Rhodocyclaceae bacterium]
MTKLLLGLIALVLVAGTLAKIFFPQYVRKPVPGKRSPVRTLFVQIAAVLLIGSAIAIVVQWWINRPDTSASTPAISFKATDITGAAFARDFALTDHTGAKRRLVDFKGKVVLMFFGYTQCPDVCPTAMQRFQETFKILGPQSSRVQVLFVTLDPERDTREVLSQYVPWFDPSFLGLYGSVEETAAVAKEYRVFYAKKKSDGALAYTLDHWAGAYAYDPAGRLRLYLPPALTAAEVAADVRTLLQ